MDEPVPSTSSTIKKRKKESAPNEDDPHPKRTQPDRKTDIVASSAGLKNSLHGNIFQLKLLNLFLLQGLDAGYDFLLATERPDLGDKFDDLVFKFWPNTSKRSKFKIRFVQAKHKQSDSETIKASHLLNCTEGEFSLVKYFLSFRHIYKKYSSNLHDVVICSNAGLDEESLNSKGFSLIPHPNSDEDKMFTFGTLHHLQLQNHSTSNPHELCVKLKECSTIHLLASDIIKSFSNKTKMTSKNPLFKLYHFALTKERVLVVKSEAKEFLAEFHDDFKDNRNKLSPRALELRKILRKDKTMWETLKVAKCQTSKTFGKKTAEAYTSLPCDHVTDSEIDEFFKKLVFAKVPNEVELGKILTASVGKRYGLNNSYLQSASILTEILNWFKTKESKFMSAKEGLKILKENEEKIKALQYTWSSLHYQEIVTEDGFSFSPEAIQQTAARLKTFLDSSDEDCQELQMFTLSCRLSCIKLHFALRFFSEFEPGDSYWMLQYSDLKAERNLTLLKNMMKSTDSPKLLIIVCDDTVPPPYLKASDIVQKQQKMILLIESEAISDEGVSEKKVKVEKDEINFRDLSEESQTLLLNVSVNFQGEKNLLNVKTLIQSDDPSQVIDSISLLQLYLNRTKGIDVGTAPPVSSQYDECLYIDRRLVSPFPLEEFESHIRGAFGFGEMFKLSDKGNIEWMTENYEERAICWKGMKGSIVGNENNPASQKYTITESELLNKWGNSNVVIVSDIPGIGKSALLTHLYGQIKKAQPYGWVVRINLNDCANLFDANMNLVNATDAIDFLMNSLMETSWNSSSFAKILFRYRLLKSREVVQIMLDGFDEMHDHSQVNAILWIKALLKQSKVNRIYVTTRPHMKEELENHFLQFSFGIADFSEQDQQQYLTHFWTKKLNMNDDRISLFAETLVELAKENLKDGERIFTGVPLHCRMLGDCFMDFLKKEMQENGKYDTVPIYLDGTFDRVSLFRLYWKTKCKILNEEKRKNDLNNVFKSVADQAESIIPRQFFQKLAIDTLFDENSATVFWDRSQLKSVLQQYSDLSFVHGLTEKNGNKQRFHHLMSAEYFVADYVFCTFEDEERSESLDKDPIIDLIVKKILNEKQFNNVRFFLDGLLRTSIPDACVSWPFDSSKKLSPLLLHKHFNSRLLRFGKEEEFSICNVLFGVAKEGHAYVLGWILYCAKEAFARHSKEQVRWNNEMLSFLDPAKARRALESAYWTLSDIGCIFKRFLLWFEGANKSVLIDIVNGIFTDLSKSTIFFRWSKSSRGSELRTFLNFIERHSGELGASYLNSLSSDQNEPFILTTLLWSYGNDLELIEVRICEVVLSGLRSIFINCPGAMTQILERWFRCSFKTRLTRGKNIFTIKDWTSPSVFEHFSCLVIMIGLKYLHVTSKQEPAEVHNNFNSLSSQILCRALRLDPFILIKLEPAMYDVKISPNMTEEFDVYGLSRLQRAAICGDIESIQNILNSAVNVESLCRELTRGESGLTPLYLAVSCCQERACLMIVDFFKLRMSSEKLVDDLMNSRGCLYRSISDAQNRHSIDTERVIIIFLNVIEKTLGKKTLFEFLMKGRVLHYSINISILKFAVLRNMHDVISKLVEIFVNEKSLSDLVFNEDKCIAISALAGKSTIGLQTILKKILENILHWKKEVFLLNFLFGINRLIPTHSMNSVATSIDFVVNIFCCPVVQEFTVEKLFPTAFSCFLQLLKLKRPCGFPWNPSGFSSVWTKLCVQPKSSVKFMKEILNCMPDGKHVEEMILHDDGEGPIIALVKRFGREDVADMMRSYVIKINLPEILQNIDVHIANVIPQKLIPLNPLDSAFQFHEN
jgi:hypothetical protein